jgi:NitT/TauT family transport system substrate-binding protein
MISFLSLFSRWRRETPFATRRFFGANALFCLFLLALPVGCRQERSPAAAATTPSPLIFLSSPAATSPQLPWLAAAGDGSLDAIASHERRHWQNQHQLQTSLLAGKGDLWLGHCEGFARARAAGAPIRILAISGWRKWAIIARSRGRSWPELLREGQPFVLPAAPPSSPGEMLLEHLLAADGIALSAEPHEPNQLMLKLLSGRVDLALLPEPMISALLAKDPSLAIAATLEELYSARHGGEERVPWAGFAIHEKLIRSQPELPAKIIAVLSAAAARLAAMTPADIAAVWPDDLCDFVPRDMLETALPRELIMVKSAAEVEEEIKTFLAIVNPDLPYDPTLIWRP